LGERLSKEKMTAWWVRVARGQDDVRGAEAALAGLLVLISVVYGVAASLSLWIRGLAPARFEVPVVSVGNLVTGGTGKTPLIVYLARRLAKAGRSVAVVSRGYGREGRAVVLVSRGDRPLVSWHKAGDEPYLVALLTKGVHVVVAARRSRGVRYAVEKLGADVILLDDAFQHVQIARDLDIVVADAVSPVGNGHLLPGGMLREHPLGVRRADLLVATRCGGEVGARVVAHTLGALAPEVPVVATRMKPVELWDVLTGRSIELAKLRREGVLALSSIANPGDFHDTARRLGLSVVAKVAMPDHHRYTASDLAAIEKTIRSSGAGAVLTTEKDAVRLSGWRPAVPVIALGIELAIVEGAKTLSEALVQAVASGGQNAD
jgi:tetraacyldisaccharide 4'-kinase